MASESPLRAVLFDIDGTLVDSNYLHIDAWDRALAEVDAPAPVWKIHRSIGMDSKKLLEAVAGGVPEETTSRAKELHSDYYKEAAGRLRPFDGAQELIRAIDARGIRVVLATSAPEDELAILRGVLDVDDAVSEVTSSGDVGTAKPEPDIIEVALGKAGVQPGEAVMVGDSVWDVQAAGRAGVTAIGVLTGGVSEAELRDAGAEEVYQDVAALLEALNESLIGRRGRGGTGEAGPGISY
ncbi:MAG: family hydrolase [Naasia sp.]|jgi:HAD superfamily hydrolase (TIGR01509 family)|uniref:HAD family hydrolase n=1 Tax=Naasia sp. TaxID=2546198 RepID=UPI00262234ED|nr:HAD family hydrolase [Naasia sp.]MCU1571078.1 family hydrolase [Naasia sp.]